MTKLLSILEYLLSALAGVVARACPEPGRMVENLFESLLAQSFGE
jgi:hypothetical protein